MSLARVHNFAISLDGFGTGEGQSRDAHFGHAGERLHEWMFATRWWRPGGGGGVAGFSGRRQAGGSGGGTRGAGNSAPRGRQGPRGWRAPGAPNPPFHTPVFVLTHHTRPSI